MKSTDHPWKSLYPSIVNALQTTAVVETLERGQLKAPNQLCDLLECTLHLGRPILPDLADEIYLAQAYTSEHRNRLKELGLRNIAWTDIVDRLQADLVRPRSRTKTTPATDTWHEAFAELFLSAIKETSRASISTQQRIKRLALIPLITPNQWTGAPGVSFGGSDKVYFAYSGITPIPESLSLRLLDRIASRNTKRRVFYQALGVETCPKETVFEKIKEAHSALRVPRDPIDHLRYMYHQEYDSSDTPSWIKVPLTNGNTTEISSAVPYFPSDIEFHAYRLLRSFQVRFAFLAEALFEAESPTVRVNNEDWKTWLARMTGVRYYPCLISSSSRTNDFTLSLPMRVVLKYKPAEFLGTLRAHWDEYRSEAILVEDALRQCSVPCKSEATRPLCTTYLPTSEIVTETARLGISQHALPLLSLSDGAFDEAIFRSWKFLEEFGVASKPDLRFYTLAIEVKATEAGVTNMNEIAETYRCIAQLATIQDHDRLQ
jgi:hypothetical protein